MNTYPSSAFVTQKWAAHCGEEVDITTEGQRHLGAVIASQEYKDQYCEEKVRAWKEEIERLSEIATSQPMRRILLSQKATSRIQEVIEDLLLPTLFGQSEPLPNEVRRLTTLATGQGGLGISDLKSEAPQQFAASRLITTAHVDSITSQSSIMVPGERSTEELKRHQQSLKSRQVPKRKWIALIQASPQACCVWLTNRGTRAQVLG